MSFRTIIEIPKAPKPINYEHKLLMLGSCFTENIGRLLQNAKFDVQINPYGILYNPLSISNSLNRLLAQELFTQKDLYYYEKEGLWLSFAHHGRFSRPNATECLAAINKEFTSACRQLQQANYLVLTLGTAFVYKQQKNKELVANCHKMPASYFTHSRLLVPEIVAHLGSTIEAIQEVNPTIQILFTLSPIRHWKNGAVDNQVSKASLLVAIHELCSQFNNTNYFPAYEIMMDDLRDYRFYEKDMLHPSSTAIAYIWQQFQNTWIDEATHSLQKQIAKIQQAMQHRPRQPKREQYLQFLQQQLLQVTQLQTQYPHLNLKEEKIFFEEKLKTTEE